MAQAIDEMDAFQVSGIQPPAQQEEYDPNDAFHIMRKYESEKNNMPAETQEMGFREKIMQALMEQKNKEIAVAKQYSENPMQYLKDAGQSFVDFSKGGSDVLRNIIASTSNLTPWSNIPMSESGSGLPYEAGKIGGELLGLTGGGGLLNAGRAAAESIPGIGILAKELGGKGWLPGVTRRAIGYGGYSALQNPDDRLGSAENSAGLSMGLDAGLGSLGLAGKLAGKLKPSSFLRGNLSPQELMENLEAAGQTRTDLGNVIGNPNLKKMYENFLSKIPLGGVQNYMGKTASVIKTQGNEILQDIIGNQNSEGLKKAVQEGLKKSYRSVLATKNKLWDETNTIADELGVEVGRENLAREAKNILGEIKQSKELERKIPANIKEDLREYSDESNINTLRLSNIFKGSLGTEASKLFKESGKSFEYGIYKKLQDALKRDIEGSIEGSNSPALREKYDSAMKFHKEKVAPFEEREIAKFTRKGGDPDLILSNFIKKGDNDRSELLNKLLTKLPEEKKSLVGYGYLSKSIEDGKLNPSKLRSVYESLGDSQKDALFSKGMRERLDRYSKLTQMNTEALTSMVNPKTGSRLSDLISHALMTAGGLGGFAAHGAIGSLGGVTAGIAAPTIFSKIVSKSLTSPRVRERLVKKIINTQGKSRDTDINDKILRGIVQAIMNQ